MTTEFVNINDPQNVNWKYDTLGHLGIYPKDDPRSRTTLDTLLNPPLIGIGINNAIAQTSNKFGRVFVGGVFTGLDPMSQGKAIFHELLHRMFGESHVAVADALGIQYEHSDNSDTNEHNATVALDNWIEHDCGTEK
jgi:hypothetical protein